MLPPAPNRTTPYVLREGDAGWPVFALQGALSGLRWPTAADGDFGSATASSVRGYQREKGLVADGVAGPVTQARIVRDVDAKVHDLRPSLPEGLMRGFAEAEGGNLLGAVNWSVAGGVDCGIVQIRVYGPPYDRKALEVAYSPRRVMLAAANDFLDRYRRFRTFPHAELRGREYALRCAALAHNWPYAAEQLARYGRIPNPGGAAGWVPPSVRFPDGTPVRTRLEWCQFYAMGGPHGEGTVTKYVTSWA